MEEYVSYDEIADYAANLKATAEKMADTYINIMNAINDIQKCWKGKASTAYMEEFEKLKSVFYPSYEELIKSILFLHCVSEGYKGLEESSARKLMDILEYGSLGYDGQIRAKKKIEDINTVGKIMEE